MVLVLRLVAEVQGALDSCAERQRQLERSLRVSRRLLQVWYADLGTSWPGPPRTIGIMQSPRGWEAKCNSTLRRPVAIAILSPYPAGTEAGDLLRGRVCSGHAMAALSLQGTSQDPSSRARNQGRGSNSR